MMILITDFGSLLEDSASLKYPKKKNIYDVSCFRSMEHDRSQWWEPPEFHQIPGDKPHQYAMRKKQKKKEVVP